MQVLWDRGLLPPGLGADLTAAWLGSTWLRRSHWRDQNRPWKPVLQPAQVAQVVFGRKVSCWHLNFWRERDSLIFFRTICALCSAAFYMEIVLPTKQYWFLNFLVSKTIFKCEENTEGINIEHWKNIIINVYLRTKE